jgi:serine/threonine protein kinase
LEEGAESRDRPNPLAGVLRGALQQARAAIPAPLPLPRAFGAYELIEEIAHGGMGIVYHARQLTVGRKVALKVLAAGHFASPDFIQRFRTEAAAVASLDHPNIVPIYESGEYEGHPFFSMKFVEGGSLARRIADRPAPISHHEAAELVAKLSHAVHYAHQRGILHRDIKPGNVLLDAQGEPQLTDFGLAKLVEKDSTLTHTMAMLGTPSYMSPEQARGEAKQLTTAVDVYGLGAVFYELLAGQPPFAGGSTIDTVRQVLENEPRRPSLIRPGIDRDLETICLKCLEKDPGHRYRSAEALAADLERWRKHEPIVARPASPLERMAKWIQRNQVIFVAMVTIALLLVTGTGVSTWQAIEATRARRAEAIQREAAVGAQAYAEAQLARSEWLVYASKLALAQTDFENGNGGLARHYLSECQEKLRGWEYRYLWTRINARHTLEGHTKAVSSVAFSPDGQRMVTGSEDGSAKMWDAGTGREVFTLSGRRGMVLSVAFSPDGQRILTGTGEWGEGEKWGEGQVWDAATGQLLLQLKGHAYCVWSAAFSPDGQRIVTGAGDWAHGPGEAKVWDAATGQEVHALNGHTSRVGSVAFSPNGQRIVTGSTDHTSKVWDAATGR